MITTENMNVREVDKQISIEEISEIVSIRRDSKDKIKHRYETTSNPSYLEDSIFGPIQKQMRLRMFMLEDLHVEHCFPLLGFGAARQKKLSVIKYKKYQLALILPSREKWPVGNE